MSATWLLVIAVGLACSCVLLLGAVAASRQRVLATRKSLVLVQQAGTGIGAGTGNVGPHARDRAGRTSVLADVMAGLGSWLVNERARQGLRRRLARAGRVRPEDLAAVVDRKLMYAVIGIGIGVLLGLRFGGVAWLLAVPAAIAGFFLPDLLVYNAGLKRTDEIAKGLPDALDLLNLCVESGLSLQSALRRVATHQEGPVAQEFGRVLQETQLGVSRSDAFEALAERTQQPDMERFAAAMVQVDRLGVPIASVLREQASQMRVKRQARARELAQKVPVKILGPLLLCFLPGLFIVILGPAVVNVISILTGK